MAYVDPQSVHNPATGAVAPAAWGDTVRDCLEFLIDPPACSVYNSAAQSVANGTAQVVLNANSENFDNAAMHSTVTNPSRITIQTSGRYLIGCTVLYDADVDGRRVTQFLINGATVLFGDVRNANISAAVTPRASVTRTYVFTAGDYVEVTASHNSGAALDVTLNEFFALFLTR